jgi:hypothetical protein
MPIFRKLIDIRQNFVERIGLWGFTEIVMFYDGTKTEAECSCLFVMLRLCLGIYVLSAIL